MKPFLGYITIFLFLQFLTYIGYCSFVREEKIIEKHYVSNIVADFQPVPEIDHSQPRIEMSIEKFNSIPYDGEDEEVPSVDSILPSILQKIKDFEHFYSKTYYDDAGELTIGYGFTKDVIPTLSRSDSMSKDDADALLDDLVINKYIPFIKETVKVDLTDYQLGSLVSLLHNIGETAFERSTLVSLLNKGYFVSAADEFDNWVKIRGVRCRGLVVRRAIEKKIFLAKYDFKNKEDI